jgi:hypothetical protein
MYFLQATISVKSTLAQAQGVPITISGESHALLAEGICAPPTMRQAFTLARAQAHWHMNRLSAQGATLGLPQTQFKQI